jgi:hypothetical protein
MKNIEILNIHENNNPLLIQVYLFISIKSNLKGSYFNFNRQLCFDKIVMITKK